MRGILLSDPFQSFRRFLRAAGRTNGLGAAPNALPDRSEGRQAGAETSGAVNAIFRALPAVSLVVPALLFAVAAWHSRVQVLQEAELSVRKTTAILHEHAQKVFEIHEQVIDRIDERVAGLSWDEMARSEAIHLYLKAIDAELDNVGSLSLVAPDGSLAASSRAFPPPSVNFANQDDFAALRDGSPGTHIGRTYAGRTADQAAFNVGRRRSAAEGAFDGVILVSVPIDYFAAVYHSIAPQQDHTGALVRADGAILVRYPLVANGPDRLSASSPMWQAAATANEGAYSVVSQFDGVERIVGWKRLSGYPVYSMFSLGKPDVLAAWRRSLLHFALFAGPATAALFAATFLALRRAHQERIAVARWQEAARTLEAEMSRREEAEAILRHTQKMEAMGQLTGGVAHDFNNLLTVISGNLQLIEGRVTDERLRRFIAAAQHAARRGESLTKQLLAFSRQHPLRPEVVRMHDQMEHVATLLRQSLRGDITLEADLASDLWPVRVDPGQLELTLLNLAVNSRDAMPNGGVFRIEARNAVFQGGEEREDALVGDYVRLTVSDTGVGIAPEILKRVFEPFFTTKEVGRGTGLGLSQVYGFAKQSGGIAQIDSEPGRGTSVTIYLPRAGAEPAAEPTAVRRPARPDQGRGSVLVVDDNREVAAITATLLADLGYGVTVTDRARKALDTLDSGQHFDLVLTDIVMPGGMNGLELARAVRTRYPDTPILIVTGYSHAVSDAVSDGFVVLTKPYRKDQLEEFVARASRLSPGISDRNAIH